MLSPLDTVAELLEKYGHEEAARIARSLAARDEMRIEGFWQDLGADGVWGPEGSLAAIELGSMQERGEPDAALARDRQRFARALRAVAQDMELCGFATGSSRAWCERLRECV